MIDPDTHQAVPFTVPRETLRYRFFATAGIVRSRHHRRASPTPASSPRDRSTSSRSTRLPGAAQVTLDADGLATVTIWVVVRDDRGGESWAVRTLLVTPL